GVVEQGYCIEKWFHAVRFFSRTRRSSAIQKWEHDALNNMTLHGVCSS
ncbi:unnamed protein product, partial [Musa acuminata var. zebrina]